MPVYICLPHSIHTIKSFYRYEPQVSSILVTIKSAVGNRKYEPWIWLQMQSVDLIYACAIVRAVHTDVNTSSSDKPLFDSIKLGSVPECCPTFPNSAGIVFWETAEHPVIEWVSYVIVANTQATTGGREGRSGQSCVTNKKVARRRDGRWSFVNMLRVLSLVNISAWYLAGVFVLRCRLASGVICLHATHTRRSLYTSLKPALYTPQTFTDYNNPL